MKKISKFVPIQLDKMRNLRYGMYAISLMEDTFNKPMSKIDFDNLTMKETATIIWAGLVHEDKELTVEQVMHLIDEHSDLNTAAEIMGKAMEVGLGNGSPGDSEKN